MIIHTLIQILLIYLNFSFSKEPTEIIYNFTDFTKKGTIIGNLLLKTNQKSDKTTESFILMDESKLFVLKPNGDLFANDDIDRDQICVKYFCCKSFICKINMKAHLIANSFVSFNITIQIFDENDNKPEFLTPNSLIHIPESADLQSNFKLPFAIDKDSEMYGIDGYKLIDSSNTFQNVMISHEPYLKLLKPLDREKLDTYHIQLIVFDKNSLSSTLNMTVKVTDVNDNAPYFVQSLSKNAKRINASAKFLLDIKEDHKVSNVIYNFYAKDDDEGDNSKITYIISPVLSSPSDIVQQKFSLESPHLSAKIILRQNLDYEVETERMISLVIVATDNGKPAKSASISLTINVIDINDNSPVITESSSTDISENVDIKQQLKIFKITDKDVVSEKKIECVLSNEMSSQFRLKRYDWNLYGLFNQISFDYEIRTREIVRIICTDGAEPKRTESTDFYVNIRDENDNVPQWDKWKYEVRIHENDDPELTVTTLTAIDADSVLFGKLYYNISDGSNGNNLHFVRIDHFTGVIQMTKSIDRENFPQLEYYITVTDNYDNNKDFSSRIMKHSNKTKLIIEVKDVNDNSPEFLGKTTSFKIAENAPINTTIEKLLFRDADETPNNIFTLSLLDENFNLMKHNNWFGIMNQDTIVVINPLNREDISKVSLIVQAVDRGTPPLTSTQKIYIEILDVNDNSPILKSPDNNTFISGDGTPQSTQCYTLLTQLKADDSDAGSNGTIIYKLLDTNLSNTNDIQINEENGKISTNWKGSPLPDVGIYFLKIQIADKGSPPLSSNILLYINITNNSLNQLTEAYMSNIVILILIIVCSLALIVSLIAAIFWVRFRVSNDSPISCQEESLEREHLNKEINSHQYSLMNLDKSFRQNTYENNRLNSYEAYQGFHNDPYVQSRNHSNYSHNTIHDVLDKSRMTPCEDCLNVYGTVPAQCNRFDPSISRLRHPIIPDLNTTFSGNLISANPKSFILQSYCENDFKTVSNIQPATLMVEPNFSDSGKGGSVEDLNYRQFTGISTFTNSSFVNTSSANAKLFCQSPKADPNLNQCLYDKSSETMF